MNQSTNTQDEAPRIIGTLTKPAQVPASSDAHTVSDQPAEVTPLDLVRELEPDVNMS